MGVLTRDEVKKLLAYIRQKKPQCFSADSSGEVLDAWSVALKDYSVDEVNELFENGGFIRIPYYDYKPKALEDLIAGLDEQRWEQTPEGIEWKEKEVAEYYDGKRRSATAEKYQRNQPIRAQSGQHRH